MISLTNVDRRTVQEEENQQNGGQSPFVRSFEGFLSLGFSVYNNNGDPLSLGKNEEGRLESRLESLMMLFLCSQGVELIESTDTTSIIPICPFNDVEVDVDGTAQPFGFLPNQQENQAIVWNLPKTTSVTVPFDEDDNSNSKNNASSSIQYYTQWNFTYPVYRWGEYDGDGTDNTNYLQEELNRNVIQTGTLDTLLPWPDSIASPFGEEPYVFWDETFPPTPQYYDTSIPRGASIILMTLGIFIIVLNTLFAILFMWIARRHRSRGERKQKEERERRLLGCGVKGDDYLDSETGVSALLRESKEYALTKTTMAAAAKTSVVAASHHVVSVTSGRRNAQVSGSVGTATKERHLVARAKSQSPSSSLFPGKNLLGSIGSDQDEEDLNERADLQLLSVYCSKDNLGGEDSNPSF